MTPDPLLPPLRVLIAGNPNSGKTTLFNALSGLRSKIANYPGVTVDVKEGRAAEDIVVVDLPGIYDLNGQSIDEALAAKALRSTAPFPKADVIISVIDAVRFERGLMLTLELLKLGLPVVAVITKYDLALKKSFSIYDQLLSAKLGIPVLKISAKKDASLQIILKAARLAHTALTRTADLSAEKTFEDQARFASELAQQTLHQPSDQKSFSVIADSFALHPVLGPCLLALLMFLIFQILFTVAQYPADLLGDGMTQFANWIGPFIPQADFRSLIADGIIAGVGSVLVFVPQIALLFFLLSLLEQSGYLARAACLLDRPLRAAGLEGRSFVPLLGSFACAVPSILATRVIPYWGDRLATILVAPLISCSARIPIYTVLIAALVPPVYYFGFFSLQALTFVTLYLVGLVTALLVAFIFRRFFLRKSPSVFAMELPPYEVPSIKNALVTAYDSSLSFVKGAGTVILAGTIVLWFLASYPKGAGGVTVPHDTYAAMLGSLFEPALRPFQLSWEFGVAIIASFAAREVFVSSLATVFNLQTDDDAVKPLTELLQARLHDGTFSLASGLALLVFFVFACQCLSTLAIVRRETNSYRWPVVLFLYMTTLAYVAAYITYRVTFYFSH